MQALFLRRNISRIKNIQRVVKQAALSLVFLFVVFGNVVPAFAAYDSFKNLFGPATNPNPTAQEISDPDLLLNSGVVYRSVEGVDTNNGIKKINFIIGLVMKEDLTSIPKKEEDYYWGHIANKSFDPLGSFYGIFGGKKELYDDAFLVQIKYKDSNGTQKTELSTITGVNHDPNKNAANEQTEISILDRINSGVLRDDFELAIQQLVKKDIVLSEYAPFGSEVSVDFWYCASDYMEKGSDAPSDGDRITRFPGYCGGTAYFKIGQTLTFTLPTNFATATDPTYTPITTTGVGATGNANGSDNLPACGVVTAGGSVMGCIARVIYYVIYWPIMWFARIMGGLFDYFLAYSLSDISYRAEFAVKGWQLVRDISNIFFIIILVWTGLSTALTGKSNMKQVVPQLILNALLINFSLFGTRVIIDFSNVVARVFYNQMHVCIGKCVDDSPKDGVWDNPVFGPAKSKGLSEKIISAFNPQKMFSTKVLDQSKNTGTIDQVSRRADQADGANQTATYYIVVTLIAAFIMFGVAMMFWKVAFMFLGRVIGLYIAMIFAPFAVLTAGNMPILSGVKEFSWSGWLEDLTKYALLAPIFVFFLYIIYSLLDSEFLKIYKADVTNSFFETVIFIAAPMLIVYFMVDYGVKIAKRYSGKMGEIVQAGAMKIAGLAGGVALGGAALAGGRILGAGASAINKSSWGSKLRDMAPDSKLARLALGGLNKASAGSYDVRQTTIGKNLFKQMGVDTDQKSMNLLKNFGLGLGTDQRKGGFEADVKRRKEDKEKTAKLFEEKMTDDQIKKYNAKNKADYDKKVESAYDKELIAKYDKKTVENWKENDKIRYENEKGYVASNAALVAKIASIQPATEMKSVSELNSDRREKYAKNLEKGGMITQGLNWLGEKGELGKKTSDILGATLGAVLGEGVRLEGDKLAAKKIKEGNKITQDLEKIEKTLTKGFQDLITLQDFQTSTTFKALSATEQDDIIKHGSIQFDPLNPTSKNKGKTLYDILDAADQQKVDAKIATMKKGTTDSEKEQLAQYEEMVKVIESSRYDVKDLDKEIKVLRTKMKNTMRDPNATTQDKERDTKEFLDKISEKEKAVKHLKKWADINKYKEEQKKKLKDEDEKSK